MEFLLFQRCLIVYLSHQVQIKLVKPFKVYSQWLWPWTVSCINNIVRLIHHLFSIGAVKIVHTHVHGNGGLSPHVKTVGSICDLHLLERKQMRLHFNFLCHTDFIMTWYKSLQTTNVKIPDITVVTPRDAKNPEQKFLHALILNLF